MTEEVRNGVLLIESASFRLYATVEDSYRDHSDCLASRSNYVALFLQNSYDYKVWAKGLQAAGYATDKHYADKLITIIEKFNLNRFDQIDGVEKFSSAATPAETPHLESLKKAIETLETVLYEAEMYKEELEERLDDKNETLNDLVVKQKVFQEKVQSEIEVLASNLTAQQTLIGEVQNRLQSVEDVQRSMNADPWADQFNSDGTSKEVTEIFPSRNLNSEGVFYQSGRKATIAKQNRNLLEIAVEYDIEFKNLLQYNDLDDDADLPEGYYVYLEPKANYVEDKVPTHQVIIGETIHTISQRYGIKASKLYQRNHIRKGEEPKVGEYIFLNKSSKEKPAVHSTTNGANFGAGGANR
jgi:LysM repeat protein